MKRSLVPSQTQSRALRKETPDVLAPRRGMFHEMDRGTPFRSLPGLALAAPRRDPSPLKQAAEPERVSGSQYTQHVLQAHLRLAHVEVLQGCGEGWGAGGSTETEPSAWGSAPRLPHSQAPAPAAAGCSSVRWLGSHRCITDTAQAPSLAEETEDGAAASGCLPQARSREPVLGVRGHGSLLTRGPGPCREVMPNAQNAVCV